MEAQAQKSMPIPLSLTSTTCCSSRAMRMAPGPLRAWPRRSPQFQSANALVIHTGLWRCMRQYAAHVGDFSRASPRQYRSSWRSARDVGEFPDAQKDYLNTRGSSIDGSRRIAGSWQRRCVSVGQAARSRNRRQRGVPLNGRHRELRGLALHDARRQLGFMCCCPLRDGIEQIGDQPVPPVN